MIAILLNSLSITCSEPEGIYMNNFRITVAALFLALSCSEMPALQPIGKVASVSGNATAEDADGKIRGLSAKSDIFLNDTVETMDHSRVQIRFIDNTVISQGEKARIKIDKYVYSPDKKSDNSFLGKVLKGAFRIVTGKITELNPDRFKIKTRMSTIGIRGCGIGILSLPNVEKIYSLELSDGSKLTIMAVGGGSGVLDEPGFLLTITSDGKISRSQRISLEEARLIMNLTAPDGAGTPSPGFNAPGDGGWLGNLWPIPDPTQGGKSGGKDKNSGNVPNWADQPYVPDDDDDDDSGDSKSYPIVHPKVYTPQGSGGEWSWTEWSQTIEELVNGSVVTTTKHGLEFNPDAGAEWTDVAAVGSPMTLTGIGPAAAWVVWNGQERPRLDGSVNFTVTLDTGTGWWDGTFTMNSANDNLSFSESNGTVASDGQLSFNGPPGAYQLSLDSGDVIFPLGTLTGGSLNGQLVGGAGFPSMPTGATMEFQFENGTAVTTTGGAGTDIF